MYHKNLIKNYIILFLLGLLVFIKASLVGYGFMGNNINAETISVGVGTSIENAQIISFLQDSEGFVWFVTPRGIVRYDGNNQKILTIEGFDGEISSVDHGKDDNFWIGTNKGDIFKFDLISYEFEKVENEDLPSDEILSVFYGANDNLWIGTQEVLYMYKVNKDEVVSVGVQMDITVGASIQGVRKIAEDKDGNILIGTDDGVIYYDISKEMMKSYIGWTGAPNSRVNSIEFDEDNIAWIASENGFYRLDINEDEFTSYANVFDRENTISSTRITDLTKAKNGDIFLGTWGEGLQRFNIDSQRFEIYKYDNSNPFSISGNRVNSVFADEGGNIWIGMNGEVNLISRYENIFNHTKRMPERSSSLLNDNVTAISKDSKGNLWIGSRVGLSKYQNESGVYINYRNEPTDSASLSADHITSIAYDKDGVWVGTRNAGLNRFDHETSSFERISSRTEGMKLSGDHITALAVDSNNLLYVGTTRGLNILDYKNGTVEKIENAGSGRDEITSTNIRSIFIDKDDFAWIGTDSGLNRLDRESGTFKQYRSSSDREDSLSNDRVNTIWQDGRSFLWVGTADGVLQRLERNGDGFIIYDSQNGIEVDTIYGVLGYEDILWISSNRGIYRFNTQNENIRRYTRTNGLQNNQFNHGAFFISDDGKMFFGGDNGFNSFHSMDIEDFYSRSPITITNVYLDGIEVERGSEIGLNHQNNTLTIEFATLDYTLPETNQYEYQLEGVDVERVDAGNRNFASYTNLGPGNYEFSVIGRNFAGVWNDLGAQLEITVKPHPLRTWWAYTIYVIIIVGGIVTFVKVKTSLQEKEIKRQKLLVENLQKLDKMKDDFLANTSHELRTPLNGIIGISETLRDGLFGELPQKAKNNINVVLNSSKRLLKMVNDILDLSVMNKGEFTIETTTLNFRNILDECFVTLESLSKHKNLEIIDNVDNMLPLVEADPQRIQQIIFNIVGNAIKFTSQGNIEIGSKVKGKLLEIYVKDTGRGIPKEKLEHIFKEFVQVDASNTKDSPGTGLGLAITKNLVELMGGELSVESKVGEGSVFRFSLPISDKKHVEDNEQNKVVDYSGYVLEDLDVNDVVIDSKAPEFSEAESFKSDKYKYKILIVDDETINRVDLNNRFTAEGNFIILNAADGVEAIEVVEKEEDLDLILMDVMMPRMSGIDATKRIRSKYSHYELPILMLTAKDQVKDILEGFSAGANDYLSKPYDREILKVRSRNLLGLKRGVKVALETANSLKGEKQKRIFSEMLVDIANEISKTLNTSKVLSLVTSRMQNYFNFEKSVGCIMVEGGIKFVGLENKQERDEILASFLENSEKDFVKSVLKFAMTGNYRENIETVRKQGFKSSRKWIHFPIVYSERLHGIISVSEDKSFPLDDVNKNVVKGIISHVAASIENSKLYGRVKSLATVDSLTGLNSRRHFFDKVSVAYENALQENIRFNIIMMDIDNFKNINDTYGHGVGDETLKKIGGVLKSIGNDNIVLGRFGGEEFIVAYMGGKEVLKLAEKIRKMVESAEIDAGNGEKIKVTVSVGVSTVITEGESMEAIIKRADEKLYTAKSSGKNRVIFDDDEFN